MNVKIFLSALMCLLIVLVIPASAAITKTTSFFEDGGNNYTIIKWTTDLAAGAGQDSTTWDADAYGATEVEYLVIAGGGGGGSAQQGASSGAAGGGGAGGVRAGTDFVVAGTISIKIGAGGTQGTNGSNSSFSTISASGGGAGGIADGTGGPSSGGSGGGAGSSTYITGASGNSGGYTPVEGYAGGNGYSNAAGGGGGASEVGTNGINTIAGDGGDGVSSSITGTSIYYGGGGGGGLSTTGTPSSGGNGGGGAGGYRFATPAGVSGTNTLGGGGGGGSYSMGAGGSGGSGVVIIRYLTPPRVITSNFTASNTSGLQPLLVQFTDTSTTSDATIDLWDWDFGDGTTSTDQNPDHTYVSAGTYVANLTITNTTYSLISTKLMDITVTSSVVVANFSANATTGYPNHYFQFSDLTSGTPLTWAWDFGDGNTSTDQNPIHQYITVGSYDVSLNVTNATSFNLLTKPGYITISVLPPPSALEISANKTYSTDTPFAVLFTTSATNPEFTYRNLSFGDGNWYNTTTYADTSITHTYTAVGDYTVSLYETNAAGTTQTTSSDFIVVSNPTLVMYPQDLSVSRGKMGLMTLRISNLSHVDGGATNITFNRTAVTIDSITSNKTSSQNFTVVSTINNADGIASVGISCVDISSLSSNVDIVDIVWRANATRTNDTAPVSFNSTAFTSFIKSNLSYNGFRYQNITYLKPGIITLTDETWTRTLLFKNAYNLNPIFGIQVRISYTGIINGSDITTTGMYDLSSTYGTTAVTASVDGYYNVTQDVTFADDGTDTFLMTPLSGAPGQTTWYTPTQMRLQTVTNPYGTPIAGVLVTATPMNFTAPDDWTQTLIGIQPSVNMSGTTLYGTTGTDGSWVAPVLQSYQYHFTFTNASAGINQESYFYPVDPYYRIFIDTGGATNNTYSQITGTNLTFSQPNTSYITVGMNYQDTSSLTENVTFTVEDWKNGTVFYTQTFTSGFVTSSVSSSYTFPNTRGDEFIWKYVAYRSDGSILTQGNGGTSKGPSGVGVDLGLPLDWYKWISICIIFLIGSMSSQRTKQYWAILIPIFAAIFMWWGWFTGTQNVWGLIVLCAVFGAIIYMKSALREKHGVGGPGSMLINIVAYLIIIQACIGFVNGLAIWDTSLQSTISSPYQNVDITTDIPTMAAAGGILGDAIAMSQIVFDLWFGLMKALWAVLTAIAVIYPSIIDMFPFIESSAEAKALLVLFQLGIWFIYLIFAYKFFRGELGTVEL